MKSARQRRGSIKATRTVDLLERHRARRAEVHADGVVLVAVGRRDRVLLDDVRHLATAGGELADDERAVGLAGLDRRLEGLGRVPVGLAVDASVAARLEVLGVDGLKVSEGVSPVSTRTRLPRTWTISLSRGHSYARSRRIRPRPCPVRQCTASCDAPLVVELRVGIADLAARRDVVLAPDAETLSHRRLHVSDHARATSVRRTLRKRRCPSVSATFGVRATHLHDASGEGQLNLRAQQLALIVGARHLERPCEGETVDARGRASRGRRERARATSACSSVRERKNCCSLSARMK